MVLGYLLISCWIVLGYRVDSIPHPIGRGSLLHLRPATGQECGHVERGHPTSAGRQYRHRGAISLRVVGWFADDSFSG